MARTKGGPAMVVFLDGPSQGSLLRDFQTWPPPDEYHCSAGGCYRRDRHADLTAAEAGRQCVLRIVEYRWEPPDGRTN